MDTYIRAMLRILGILALFIVIGWYGNLSHVRKDTTTHEKEYNISYKTAKDRLVHPVYITNTYHYQKITTVHYTRTMIPFVYKVGTTLNKKQYYSRGAN